MDVLPSVPNREKSSRLGVCSRNCLSACKVSETEPLSKGVIVLNQDPLLKGKCDLAQCLTLVIVSFPPYQEEPERN